MHPLNNIPAFHKLLLAALLAVLCLNTIHAQKQNNNWRFGFNVGIDFNSGSPLNATGCQMQTPEGSASISDPVTGALLFYTDGVTVWNANNTPMPNGNSLTGGTPLAVNPGNPLSSTSAAVIVPRPYTPDIYYVITIDQQDGGNGLRFSVVDMTLNGGLGDVVTGQKNIFLYNTSSEKLQVVPTADGCGYWLITHNNPGNTFISFKITQSGISNIPVLSNAGTIQTSGLGHFKVNRQFTKIAMGNAGSNNIELFDFNNASGIVSNAISWNYVFPPSFLSFYGVEFSPDGSKLYVSNFTRIAQYDISSGTPAVIQASGFNVTSSSSLTLPGTLQLGPDNKIYVASNPFAVISSPDNGGAACNLQLNPVPGLGGTTRFGLPQWIYTITIPPVNNAILYTGNCTEQAIPFSLQSAAGVVTVLWNFGDPASGAGNTSTLINPSHSYSQDGSYTVEVTVNYSCYSVVITRDINIINCCVATVSTTNTSICAAQLPYVWNGSTYTIAGTYTKTLINIAGCDSVATLNLTVNPVLSSTTDLTICSSQLPYVWNGNSYAGAGTYSTTLLSVKGCDSIATLNLTVNPVLSSTTNLSICSSQLPYVWNENSYTAAGTYSKTLLSVAGCDSIATLNLTVNPVLSSMTNLIICSSQLPYVWNGNSYAAAGTYSKTLLSVKGCDSIATLNLTVNPVLSSITDLTICSSQLPYVWNGNSYTAAGTYTKTLLSVAGCDSIATLNLTVNPVLSSTTNLSICSSQLPYTWNGNAYTTAGTYTKTLLTVAGCDSIATLNLTVNPVLSSTTNLSICSSQLPYTWNGNAYTAAGTYTKTLLSLAGCDSVATLNLTVSPVLSSTTNLSICSSQLPYTWNGNSYTAAGTYTKTLLSVAGCDSIATLNLTVNPVLNSTTNLSICSSQLPYTWNGNSYAAAGTYTKTLPSVAGCDSIATLNLTVSSILSSTTNLTICSSQLPYTWNGNAYTTAGTYTKTLLTVAGCDSIATLNLTVNPVLSSTTNLNICPSQLPYVWNGNSYDAAGTYTKTLLSVAGCDSTATLNLIINPVLSSTTDLSICPSQLPYLWNGNTYTAAGTYTKTLLSVRGCDSIATLNLTVNPVLRSITDLSICPSQLPYLWNGNTYTAAGTYIKALASVAGCDSIATLNLTINSALSSITDLSICPSQLPYTWNGNTYNAAGTYMKTLLSLAGCDSVATLVLTVSDTPSVSFAGKDTSLCPGQTLLLSPGSYAKYLWQDLSTDASLSVTRPGNYTVTVTNDLGCSSSVTIAVNYLPDCSDIYFPNSFSPNNDGVNDRFGAAGRLVLISNYSLFIYNRYGNLLFSTTNPYQKWDGMYKGKKVETEGFVWYSRYLINGIPKMKKGYVLAVR